MIFVNLRDEPVERLSRYDVLRGALTAMKVPASKVEVHRELSFKALAATERAPSTKELIIHYLGDLRMKNRSRIDATLQEVKRVRAMSFAEYHRSLGYRHGRKRGLERGLRRSLRAVLTSRFGPLSRELEHHIEVVDAAQLEPLLARAVTVRRAASLFASR